MNVRRVLRFILILAPVLAATLWLADQPGAVTLDWFGWRLETTTPVLMALVVILALLLALIFGVLRFLLSAPRRMRRARAERRRHKGYLALTQGLVAVAAGDTRSALKLSKRAEALLREAPLTRLLSAQAAQMAGDEETAGQHFRAMLESPETAFLGLRGLSTQALKSGDKTQAQEWASRAHALMPASAWPTDTLFDLAVAENRWRDALKALDENQDSGRVDAPTARRRRAVLLDRLAEDAQTNGDETDALRLARKAHDLDAGFASAALRLAHLLHKEGREKKAAAVLESSWTVKPHADLARAYLGLWPDADDLSRARRTERLAAFHPGHVESRLVVADAALKAKLWGRARAELALLTEKPPILARACRLMAQLEEGETGGSALAREWLARAVDAPYEPAWHCKACAKPARDWTPRCTACGGFDSLVEDAKGTEAVLVQ